MSWLMWQMGGLGPMQGQAAHFFRFAKEKIPYGINRYQNETERLYQVLETSLGGKEWLANNEYSIADMASFPWVYAASIAGQSNHLCDGCVPSNYMLPYLQCLLHWQVAFRILVTNTGVSNASRTYTEASQPDKSAMVGWMHLLVQG